MKVEEYRTTLGLTYRGLAAHLEISKSTAFNLCTNAYDPSLSLAYHVSLRSGGAIGILDMLKKKQEATSC